MRLNYHSPYQAYVNLFQPIRIDTLGSELLLRCHKIEAGLPNRTLRGGGPTQVQSTPSELWQKRIVNGADCRFNNWWEVKMADAIEFAEVLLEQVDLLKEGGERKAAEVERFPTLEDAEVCLREASQRSV